MEVPVGSSAVRTGIIMVLLILGYMGAVTVVNDMTRADLSQHISTQQCGVLENSSGCPGKLQCFSIDSTNDRLPQSQDIPGNRCVTPTYEQLYCGLFATNIRQASLPPGMASCYPLYNPITNIQTLMEDGDLYDRFFNTNRNGTELIRSYGLEPLSQ